MNDVMARNISTWSCSDSNHVRYNVIVPLAVGGGSVDRWNSKAKSLADVTGPPLISRYEIINLWVLIQEIIDQSMNVEIITFWWE